MKHTLKTKLSLTIAFVSLLLIAIISLLSNFLIQDQFKGYITRQQEIAINEIVTAMSQQYDKATGEWDVDFVHTIGMNALYDGFIVKVYDVNSNSIWDGSYLGLINTNTC